MHQQSDIRQAQLYIRTITQRKQQIGGQTMENVCRRQRQNVGQARRGVRPATTTINNGSGEAQDAGNDFCGKEIFLVFSYSDFL